MTPARSKIFKFALIAAGGVIGVALAAATGGYVWVSSASASMLSRDIATHQVDFPVPFPLEAVEIEQITAALRLQASAQASALPQGESDGADEAVIEAPEIELPDFDAIALQQAIERGSYLVRARYACVECHGEDFGGGVMVEDPLLGDFYGPNLTSGQGGVTASYSVADWDRIIRHGVKANGKPAVMPSIDFFSMSDQELSDVIAFARSRPPVDRTMPQVLLRPFGQMLVATQGFPLSSDRHSDHLAEHLVSPPNPADTLAFGSHVAQPCAGCHRPGFEGGPILGAPPDWLPAGNLTPHIDGLQGWTYEDFSRTLREGVRPDGSKVGPPMDGVPVLARHMDETDLQAMYAFLSSLPPTPTGQ